MKRTRQLGGIIGNKGGRSVLSSTGLIQGSYISGSSSSSSNSNSGNQVKLWSNGYTQAPSTRPEEMLSARPNIISLEHQVPETKKQQFEEIFSKKAWIVDMDGVIYHQSKLIPGAKELIEWLRMTDRKFLFLTNSSDKTPQMLVHKLARLGITGLTEANFFTSALATASFIKRQKMCSDLKNLSEEARALASAFGACSSAYVIGGPGLTLALSEIGVVISDYDPDYVIVGETTDYDFAKLEKAVTLVRRGARLIGTNCDIVDKAEQGYLPACGSLIKPIECATGVQAYFLGKPNPLIMRHALRDTILKGVKKSETIIIGDRMDTDIIAGVESEIDTVLVLSGVTSIPDLSKFSFDPSFILESVASVTKFAPLYDHRSNNSNNNNNNNNTNKR